LLVLDQPLELGEALQNPMQIGGLRPRIGPAQRAHHRLFAIGRQIARILRRDGDAGCEGAAFAGEISPDACCGPLARLRRAPEGASTCAARCGRTKMPLQLPLGLPLLLPGKYAIFIGPGYERHSNEALDFDLAGRSQIFIAGGRSKVFWGDHVHSFAPRIAKLRTLLHFYTKFEAKGMKDANPD